MRSFVRVDNKRVDILIIDQGPAEWLGDTTLIAEGNYPVNFTQSRKTFVLNLHNNGSNSLLFVNASKVYQFKAKRSEMKGYALCLGNFSKNFRLFLCWF